MKAVRKKIKRGDSVLVVAGRDKGKRGKVIRVFPDDDRALVEGVNFITKATRPNPQLNQTGGFVTKESTIALSNIVIYCDTCQKGVRTSVRKNPQGKSERICKKCNGVV